MKGGGVSTVAIMTTLSATVPAHTAIENSAVAVGTFSTADDTTSAPSTQSVPVIAASRDLNVVKSVATGPTTAGGTDGSVTDAGDTITYLYIITNAGNVTETGVTPVDAGPTFGGAAPTNSLSAFTEVAGGSGTAASLAPGQTVHFNATYTFAAIDVYRAAAAGANSISNSATASSANHTDTDASVATATIPANPALSVAKVAVLNDLITADSLAEVGETITYTYTVTNTGNVPITNVGIQDTHEGVLLSPAPAGETITTEGPVQASDIGVANDGVIAQLEAGAAATFTYVHTVTQEEVDNQ